MKSIITVTKSLALLAVIFSLAACVSSHSQQPATSNSKSNDVGTAPQSTYSQQPTLQQPKPPADQYASNRETEEISAFYAAYPEFVGHKEAVTAIINAIQNNPQAAQAVSGMTREQYFAYIADQTTTLVQKFGGSIPTRQPAASATSQKNTSSNSKSEPRNRAGMTKEEALDKSLALHPSMTSDEVIALLGKPDETSSGTYGTQTAQPWNGITYLYMWKDENGFPTKTLSILFQYVQSPTGTLVYSVNSWQWRGL